MRIKIEKQQGMVKDQINQYQEIDDQMIFDRKNFEAKQEENKSMYDDFMGKVKNLEKKIFEYQYLTVYQETEDEIIVKKQLEDKEEFEKLKMKLLDIEHKNQFLQSKINEAEKQIIELETLQVPLTLKEKLEMYKMKKEQTKSAKKGKNIH